MPHKKLPVFLSIAILIFVSLACNSLLPQQATLEPQPTGILPPTRTPSSGPQIPESEASVPRVSPADAKAAFDRGEAIIVDVRSPQAYADGHIAGAISIPLGDIESHPENVNRLDPKQWIITYCTWQNEHTSARAAFILLHNGYEKVTPILGGLAAWVDAGFPIEP